MKPFAAGSILLLLALCCATQELPSKIRGYKVHSAKVAVIKTEASPTNTADIVVRVDDPKDIKLGIFAVDIPINAEILSKVASGEIDAIMFRDFQVNGLPIDVDEIRAGFKISKNKPLPVSVTVRVRLGAVGTARAAYSELADPKRQWAVRGTMLVFGKFRRFGLTFKRVIPIKTTLTINNPLR